MRTLKIDPLTGDLAFSAGSPVFIERAEALRQAIQSRLQTILGEWFLDTSIGLPLIKSPALLQTQVRTEVEAVDGIDTVTSIAIDYDAQARSASVTFFATTDTGEPLDIAVKV